jgi:hypothetical protein
VLLAASFVLSFSSAGLSTTNFNWINGSLPVTINFPIRFSIISPSNSFVTVLHSSLSLIIFISLALIVILLFSSSLIGAKCKAHDYK